MTKKTKPTTSDMHSIENVLCKKAGKALYDQLAKDGVELTGYGITLSDDKKEAAIRIMLMNQDDLAKVPETFKGFQVKPVVTGVIRAL